MQTNPYDAAIEAAERGDANEARLLYMNAKMGPAEIDDHHDDELVIGRCLHCDAWFDECMCDGGLAR